MKHIAIVALSCVLAVGVSAQQQAAPSLFDQAVAAEDQEHDLDKALGLYREAFEKAVAADDGDKMRISGRLYHLLRRLGRDAELKAFGERLATLGMSVRVFDGEGDGQDPEREKELRKKTRELLGRLGQPAMPGGPVHGLAADIGEQLLWIGRPAVPEIIAKVQSIQDWPSPAEWSRIPAGAHIGADGGSGAGLMRVLWRLRGPQADEFLTRCAADPTLCWVAARTAGAAVAIDPDLPLFRAYLEHEDPRIIRAFLDSEQLVQRLAPTLLLDVAERGGATSRGYALEVLSSREFDVDLLPRAHDLARRGLAGTDPEWGKAAERFVCSTRSQRDADGLRLLLANLPQLRAQKANVAPYPWRQISGPVNYTMQIDPELLRDLLPSIDACAQQLGDVHEANDSAYRWLEQLMWAAVAAGDAETVLVAMNWWDRGFEILPVLDGRVTAANAAAVFARRREVPDNQLNQFLGLFYFGGALPREMYEPLIELAAEGRPNLMPASIGYLLVRTGDERVVDWLLEQWRAERGAQEATPVRPNARPSSDKTAGWVADCLILFARANHGEQVRAAMRELLQGVGGRQPDNAVRAPLLMALLTFGDDAALAICATDAAGCVTTGTLHPYRSEGDVLQQSPLQYLASGRPRPPHSCTEQQVVEALQKLLLSRPKGGLLDPDLLDARAMSERVLALLATHDPHGYANQTWDEVALAELSRRLQDGEPCEALAQWFGERLAAHEGSDALLVPCYPNVVTRFHDQLVSLLTSDSERWAYRAAQLLWTVDQRIDITAALQNRHGLVREWAVELVVAGEVEVPVAQLLPMLADSEEDVREELARHFGAIVSKEAVPGLIGLLRDPVDSVRTAAADALTRIRFYHEQQAHWDRVLKGLDASPASACEKLLLQAKPGQPAAQRLLAIESLGTLGVPEALPFLIDWTTDPDEAVAKAARAAITAIHLNPRR